MLCQKQPAGSLIQTLKLHCLWSLQESLYVCNVTGVGCCTWLINAHSHPSLMWRDQVQLHTCREVTVTTCFSNTGNDAETCCSVLTITVLCKRTAFASLMSVKWKEVNTDILNICLPFKGTFLLPLIFCELKLSLLWHVQRFRPPTKSVLTNPPLLQNDYGINQGERKL